MPKYLDQFPEPLLDDIVSGRSIPFVGAGFSRNAEVQDGRQMPDWDELGRGIAHVIPDHEYDGPVNAISAYADAFGRAKLVETLEEMLLVDVARPGLAHEAFCKLPFDLVCTSNWDFLLERSYERVRGYCRPIVGEDQLPVNGKGPGVLKFHGDLHHPELLIATEEDYATFTDQRREMVHFVSSLLVSNTPLFVGYSLDDPDFLHMWQVIGKRFGRLRRTAYAITLSASGQEVKRFERRGVKVINLPALPGQYSKVMQCACEELGEYWSTTAVRVPAARADEARREPSLLREPPTPLCLFAVPFNSRPFYKGVVFPVVERYGFHPITADDDLSPGEGFLAKITALIDRAHLVVIDVSSNNTRQDMSIALAKRKSKLLLIIESSMEPPSDAEGVRLLTRPEKVDTGAQAPFIEELEIWLRSMAEERDATLEGDR